MSVPTAPSNDSVTLVQIWAALNADLQGAVIRLLAQLAFNLLTTQTELSINKGASYAISSDQPQDQA